MTARLVPLLLPLLTLCGCHEARDLAKACAAIDAKEAVRGFVEFRADTARYDKQVSKPDAPASSFDVGARAKLGAGLDAMHAVLAGYFTALAALDGGQRFAAKDDWHSMADGVKSLADQRVPQASVSGADAAAAASIADLLADLAVRGFEQRSLSKLIAEHHPAAQRLIAALTELAQHSFLDSLAGERDRMRAYYGSIIASTQAHGEADALEQRLVGIRFLAMDRREEEEARFAERERQARALVRAYQALAKAEQALYDHRDQLDRDSATALFKTYRTQVQQAWRDVAAAR